jgi:hypothetical protein
VLVVPLRCQWLLDVPLEDSAAQSATGPDDEAAERAAEGSDGGTDDQVGPASGRSSGTADDDGEAGEPLHALQPIRQQRLDRAADRVTDVHGAPVHRLDHGHRRCLRRCGTDWSRRGDQRGDGVDADRNTSLHEVSPLLGHELG